VVGRDGAGLHVRVRVRVRVKARARARARVSLVAQTVLACTFIQTLGSKARTSRPSPR